MRIIRTSLAFLTVVAFALTLTQAGLAQVVPFRSIGFDNVYSPSTFEFDGSGYTRHMGRTTGSGIAIPIPTSDPLVFDWLGTAEIVAANGDSVCLDGGGQIFLEPQGGNIFTASWLGEFNVVGGTGRFSNAGPGPKPLDVIAINHPFDIANDPQWFYDYQITGQFDLGNARADK